MPNKKSPANNKVATLVASKMSGQYPELVDQLIKLVKEFPSLEKVEFQFSGGGDSGDIDHIEYLPGLPDPEIRPDFNTDPVYKIVYDEASCDWVNNDGGGGTLVVDLSEGEMHLTSYYYEQVQHDCDDKTISLQ